MASIRFLARSTSLRPAIFARGSALKSVSSSFARSLCASSAAPSAPSSVGASRKQTASRFFSTAAVPKQIVSNITPGIAEKVGRNLHLQPNHPINIIKRRIEDYFRSTYLDAQGQPIFQTFDSLGPKVTVKANFDDMLVPQEHPSRQLSDTFYYDHEYVLRTHTSAHQTHLMRDNVHAFLCTGDCYRRDEIDASHYPVFHQMEGVRIFDPKLIDVSNVDAVVKDLKTALEGMVRVIFGDVEMRWVDAYFPFTEPSIELEVLYNGKWLEVLGSGVIHRKIMTNVGLEERTGWAFGLGLERLAMVLFDISDIRLFWSKDERFLSQFASGEIVKFQPFSKHPGCTKDISIWINDGFHENDFCAVVRDIAGDWVENVSKVSEFTHPKTGRHSKLYRVTYRALDRVLTNAEVDDIQHRLRAEISTQPTFELR